MCKTVETLFDKPSNLPSALGNLAKSIGDPLGEAIFNQDAHNIRTVAGNPLLSTAGTIAGGVFGGPWGAGLVSGSLAKERGASWGDALTTGALTGATAYGMGQFGETASGGGDMSFGGGGTEMGMMGDGFSAPDISTMSADQYANIVSGGTDMASGLGGSGLGPSESGGFFQGLKDYFTGDGLTTAQKAGRMQMLNGGLKTVGGIIDADAKNKQAAQLEALYNERMNEINSLYAPGSPEALALKQQLERQDAASGRNSQYGQRSVDLAARLAGMKANARNQALPTLSNIYSKAGDLRSSANAGIYGGLGQMATGWGLSSLF